MIFGTGVVLFFLGTFIMKGWGTGNPFVHNAADGWGGLLAITGFCMALGSILHFTARVLA